MQFRSSFLALTSLSLLIAPLQAQSTWVVDNDGPADFALIQDAIEFANDGDTILVRSGTYTQISILNKSLTLQAEGEVTVVNVPLFAEPAPSLHIKDLAFDQTVLLRGFELRTVTGYDNYNLYFESSFGSIVLEDCEVFSAGHPTELRDCSSVTFTRCRIGAPPTYVSVAGQSFLGIVTYNAIGSINSNIFVYDSVLFGSWGSNAGDIFGGPDDIPPGAGGNGIVLRGGSLYASGCTITGGNGGKIFNLECHPGADGGTGVLIDGGSAGIGAVARLLDCTVLPGVGGAGSCASPDGNTPAAVEILSGSLERLNGAARSFKVTSPELAGTDFVLTAQGEPGDLAFLFFSPQVTRGLYLPADSLVAHIGAPLGSLELGTLPATGRLTATLPLPSLSDPLTSLDFTGQTVFYDGANFFDGGPSTLLIVGSGL